jgi:formyl-CoA transferase
MSATPVEIRNAPPELGQDTDAVLGEILGYPPVTIEELHAAGAV